MDLNIQIPDNTASIFEYLQKGLFISSNSTSEEVRDMYNEIDENYESLYQYFLQINYTLERGNEYFFFSRIEPKATLEQKIMRAYYWIDVLDFFKTYDETFGPGFRFQPEQILVETNINMLLQNKLDGMRKHFSDKDIRKEVLENMIRQLTKDSFLEQENEKTNTYKVMSAWHYLERLIESINIYDETYDTEEGQGGLAAALVVFNDLFGNPKEAVIKPHEYLVNTSFQWGSWMPAVEIPMEGLVFPLGTYVQLDDGTSFGQFSYGKEGIIKIEAAGTAQGEDGKIEPVYKIEFNLTSKDGFTLKGSYTGVIPITDASDDKSDDDGTSTLERDYDMDLSKIKKAHYYTSDQVYIQGIGYKPISSYGCGLQFINIGIEWVGDHLEDFVDREPGGDIIRLELVTEPGKENEITPGTYEVTEQRWPAFIKPGVMMRGIMLNGVLSGSRWMHQIAKIGDDNKVFEYMDAHALLYDGQVTITKVEGEGKENWYRFEFDGICVRKHHVRGTWEGPVVSQTGRAAAEKDHLEPPRLLRRLPAPSVPMSRLAEELPGIMFRKSGMTE